MICDGRQERTYNICLLLASSGGDLRAGCGLVYCVLSSDGLFLWTSAVAARCLLIIGEVSAFGDGRASLAHY